MRWIGRVIAAVVAVTGFAGCAFVSQNVRLTPKPELTPANLGQGAPVVVRVVDSRPSTRIGYRGMDSKLADITTEDNVPGVVQKAIMDGLKLKGFTAAPFEGQPSSRLLRVELKALDYSTDIDFLKGSVQTKAELQAYFRSGETLYSKIYKGEVKQPSMEAPRAKVNEMLINKALTEALEQMLEDRNLTQAMVVGQ